MKSFLFLSVLLLGATSFAHHGTALKSPKTIAVHWIDDNTDSVVQLDKQITTTMFKDSERVVCDPRGGNTPQIRAFYNPDISVGVDKVIYNTSGSVSMSSNELHYYFHYVSYSSFMDCSAGYESKITAVTMSAGEWYPTDRKKGFIFKWNIADSTVDFFVIGGTSIYDNVLTKVGTGKVTASY